MEYITNLPRNLLFVISIIAILVIGYKMIVYYAEHQPIYDPATGGEEDQQKIAAEHVEKRQPAVERQAASQTRKAQEQPNANAKYQAIAGAMNNPNHNPYSMGIYNDGSHKL